MTAKEAAAIAEGSGKGALVKKYSSVGTVVDITPAGNVSATGVDAHLIVGKGKEAVNVIADVKLASPTKSGGEAPVRYSGKEKRGHVGSFDSASKQNYRQLVRNIRAARANGLLDPATAFYAIEGAKAGLVRTKSCRQAGPRV